MASSLDIPSHYWVTTDIPFKLFQAFHLAFSYNENILKKRYSKSKHSRSRNITITNSSLLVQGVSSEFIFVGDSLGRSPGTNKISGFLELLLYNNYIKSQNTSRSDILIQDTNERKQTMTASIVQNCKTLKLSSSTSSSLSFPSSFVWSSPNDSSSSADYPYSFEDSVDSLLP